MKRILVLLSAVALLSVVGCGGDDSGSVAEKSSRGRETPTTLDDKAALCSEIDDADDVEDVMDLIPSEHRDAAKAIATFADAMDDGAGDEFTEALDGLTATEDGIADFRAWLGGTCGEDSESATALGSIQTIVSLASAPADDAYCDALTTTFAAEEEGSTPDFAALDASAPASHRQVIEDLAAMSGDPAAKPDATAAKAFGASLIGIGAYAQARCGIEGAAAQMALAGAMMIAGAELGGDSNPGTVGTEPPAADPTEATGRLPTSTDLTFEVRTIDLDDEAGRRVSVVVPRGWEMDEGFGHTFDPPAGSPLSIFTSLSFDDGCDGICSPNDWEERLRGKDGYITMVTDGREVTEDREPPGSDGAVLVLSEDGVATRSVVLRWDDDVDHYFRCEVKVDEDDAALLPALTAACEAARPNWFPVEG